MNCKKLAILVLAHKNPEQLNALTESLYHPNIYTIKKGSFLP